MNARSLLLPAVLAALAVSATARPALAGLGYWTPLTNQPTFPAEHALLLTDGGVLVHSYRSNLWYRLDPVDGSYINGTWTQVASMPADDNPNAFASAVLPDG